VFELSRPFRNNFAASSIIVAMFARLSPSFSINYRFHSISGWTFGFTPLKQAALKKK
jgi:hypothetical protein